MQYEPFSGVINIIVATTIITVLTHVMFSVSVRNSLFFLALMCVIVMSVLTTTYCCCYCLLLLLLLFLYAYTLALIQFRTFWAVK